MTQPIIGLCGYAGAGKDEAARGLGQVGFRRVAFADALKDLALECAPMLDSPLTYGIGLRAAVELHGWEEMKKFSAVREFLQNLGTGVRRVVGPDTWVEIAFERIGLLLGDPVVITDVRFANEIDRIRDSGGKIIRINRPGVGPVNDHVSEAEWTDYAPDALIVNDRTVHEFHAEARMTAEDLYGVCFHGNAPV